MLTVNAIPLLLAITLHEAAHGYAGAHVWRSHCGNAGPNFTNPIRHIDPIGTLLVPALTLAIEDSSAGRSLCP